MITTYQTLEFPRLYFGNGVLETEFHTAMRVDVTCDNLIICNNQPCAIQIHYKVPADKLAVLMISDPVKVGLPS